MGIIKGKVRFSLVSSQLASENHDHETTIATKKQSGSNISSKSKISLVKQLRRRT